MILQLVILGPLQKDVLAGLHKGELGDHLRVDKTFARLKEWFYWPGHHQDVQNWCGKCVVCAFCNSPTHSVRAPNKCQVRNSNAVCGC